MEIRSVLCCMLLSAIAPPGVQADEGLPRHAAVAVQVDQLQRLTVTTSGKVLEQPTRRVQGGCTQQVSAHTDASFEGGQFVVQAGFVSGEIAAASYTVPAANFPLQINLIEMIFATNNATVTTTTMWSVLVWEGTPNTGSLIAEFSSDGEILPHIVLPPGTNGVNVAVMVDPGDPEQIIVNDNGTQTFSVGYRIDLHNSPSPSPCTQGPPTCCNAFPTTDVGGLASSPGNWLFGIDCGLLGCPANGGWASFQTLPFFCTPSGDWVVRATWTPLECAGELGACCLADTQCVDVVAPDCSALEGSFQGVGTDCAAIQCPEPTVACCFPQTGGCLDLALDACNDSGTGFPLGPGTACASDVCFPIGACCLTNGACLNNLTPEDCNGVEGVFQGDGTVCNGSCPDPPGACCFPNDFCLVLTEPDCQDAAAEYQGPVTDCADNDGSGIADICEAPPCPADLNGDGVVNAVDLAELLGSWGPCPGCAADFTGNGQVDAADLAQLLGDWGPCD